MREIEDQVAKRIYLPEKKVPLFSKVADDWLEHKKLNIRESSWKMYQGHIKTAFQKDQTPQGEPDHNSDG